MDDDIQARLLALAARDPLAPVIRAPGREPMTRGALAAQISGVRARFARWRIARGDVVLAPVFDRPLAMGLYASIPASATLGLVSARSDIDACGSLIQRTRARAVIVPAGTDHPMAAAARDRGVACIAASADPDIAGSCTLDLADPGRTLDGAAPRHPPGWAYLCVTSGTTDRPKLVPYGHRQLLAVADAMGECLRVVPDDVSGVATPLNLANGQRTALALPILHGASALALPEADVDALLEAIVAEEVSFVSASYSILHALLDRAGSDARIRSTRLRFLRAASGALDPPVIEALERVFGVPAICGLATTESGVVTHQPLPPRRRTVGSVGWPLLAQVRLVDEAGRAVGIGEIGEVQVRGPQIFDGYLDDDELERRSRVDGWLRLGDLARADPSGEIFLVGRIKDVINRGGDKIAPLEIDAALRAIAGVADAAAFAIPHPTLGEEVAAAVVLEASAAVSADEIAAAARSRLGANRAPRRVWIVDALPRNEAGKLVRRELAALVGATVVTGRTPADSGAGSEVLTPIEALLAGLWASALGTPVTDAHAPFSRLGGDAVRAREIAASIRAVLGVDIDAAALADGDPTLVQMARRLDGRRG